MLFTSFLLSALLVGCNDSEKSETEKTSKFQKFDKTDINKAAEQVNPVPSPLKMSEMLQKAKIEAKVSKLVQVTKNPELKDDKESIAVQCGYHWLGRRGGRCQNGLHWVALSGGKPGHCHSYRIALHLRKMRG